MHVSCYSLSRYQASLLTGMLEGTLRQLCLRGTIQLLEMDEECYWQVIGTFESEDKEAVAEEMKDIEIIAGARYLGTGALAFYVAKSLGMRTLAYKHHCLTIDYINPKDWAHSVFSTKVEMDAIWGEVSIDKSYPFQLVETVETRSGIITVVKWKGKHHHSAEQYIQFRRRGFLGSSP